MKLYTKLRRASKKPSTSLFFVSSLWGLLAPPPLCHCAANPTRRASTARRSHATPKGRRSQTRRRPSCGTLMVRRSTIWQSIKLAAKCGICNRERKKASRRAKTSQAILSTRRPASLGARLTRTEPPSNKGGASYLTKVALDPGALSVPLRVRHRGGGDPQYRVAQNEEQQVAVLYRSTVPQNCGTYSSSSFCAVCSVVINYNNIYTTLNTTKTTTLYNIFDSHVVYRYIFLFFS
jgi:hypothetical protein